MGDTLDADQEACVRALGDAVAGGTTLVAKAGAGSGKTHTMAYAMARHPGALGFSHTNLACDAIRERIERYRDAHDAHISTIHSVAARLIGKEGAKKPLDPESGTDFDRMLEGAIAALRRPECALPDWLATRRYIVVDEFQDTGTAQSELVFLLRRRLSCALVVVGDFAQAIYGFQGATPEHMNSLRAREDCVEVTLRSNYRSHPSIVAHANRLSRVSGGGIRGSIEMRATRNPPQGGRLAALHLRCYRGDVDMVHAIVRWILHRTSRGILFAGDALTLYPSRGEARDYAHRRLPLAVDAGADAPADGAVAVFLGRPGEALPVGEVRLLPGVVDREGLSAVVVRNPQRRILVACRSVAGKRQVLNQVYSNLITRERFAPDAIFITDSDDRRENDDGRQRMRGLAVSLSTVHGAKGEEWDSVLHVDLGELLSRPMAHDDEQHRILYVSHTRAIDELWHVAVSAPNMTLTRYMTEDLGAHFRTQREAWEDGGPPAVAPAFFRPNLRVDLEMRSETLSIAEVAKVTRTVWEPTEERPPVQSVVWERTPKLRALPASLHFLNAAHGIFLEWTCLWHMHESATRRDILDFLQAILRQYSVNRAFAAAMQRVFDEGTLDERRRTREEFDRLRLATGDAQAAAASLYRTLSAASRRAPAGDAASPVLRLADVQSAMANLRMQHSVRPDPSPARCPVRPTIRHFDSHTGADSWKLEDAPGLKARVLSACRAVSARLSEASTSDRFVCLLFMQSVQMLAGGRLTMGADERAWRVLLTVLRSRGKLGEYVAHVDSQLGPMRLDALALREHLELDAYQDLSEAEVSIRHTQSGDSASYRLVGRADAASADGVLEVTSRDADYGTKVQQAFLYASILGKARVYNYYIENRLLVQRTRREGASGFLERTAEDLVLRRGLPGLRERIDRPTLSAEWSVRHRKREREGGGSP